MVHKMKFCCICLIVLAAFGCQSQSDDDIILNINLGSIHKQSKVRVLYQDSTYICLLDTLGKAQLTIKGQKASGYATLFAPRSIKELYLEDGKSLTVSNLKRGVWEFDGTGKQINEYLNSRFVSTLGVNASLDEKEFISEWKKVPARIQTYLDSLSLPNDFKKIEEKRLYYLVCNMLLDYPLHHCRQLRISSFTPTESFYAVLKDVMKEDNDVTDLWIYRQAYKNYIATIVRRNSSGESPAQTLEHLLGKVKLIIKNTTLQNFISSMFLDDFIQSYGIESIEKPFLKGMESLAESSRKQDLKQKYEEYSRLTQGKPAPEFCLEDIEGKMVHLSDFKGKLVYIDVWASWCRPCCNEMPFLHKIEESLKGEDVVFISVSIDQKKEDWLKKIEQEKLRGIQLHLGKDSNFRKDYRVGQIPHFILIDKQGNILNANMTRPSNPKTLEMLKERLK